MARATITSYSTFTIVLEKSLEDIADELVEWANGRENKRLDDFFEKGSTIDPKKPLGISLKAAALAAAKDNKGIRTVNGVNAVKIKPVSAGASVTAGRAVEVTAPGGDNGGNGGIYRDQGLTNRGNGGIIDIGSEKMLKVNTGGRRNEYNLTEGQLKEVIDYAVSLGMPRNRIYYVDYDCTGYGTAFDLLRIGTDVYPCKKKQKNANSNISMRGAIAHEIIGHRAAALAGKTHSNDVLEEVQASIRAARFTPNLSDSERIMLYRDAITRLRNNGIKLRDIKNDLYIWKE